MSATDTGLVCLHRQAASEGEQEPEHDTSGETCWCNPFRFDPTDPRFTTHEQMMSAAEEWWQRWSE